MICRRYRQREDFISGAIMTVNTTRRYTQGFQGSRKPPRPRIGREQPSLQRMTRGCISAAPHCHVELTVFTRSTSPERRDEVGVNNLALVSRQTRDTAPESSSSQ